MTLALDDAEAFPKEGNLRGATMRTEMGTYHIRPFGQPCIEGFFGGSFARELEDAGDGAIAAQSIDEIAGFLGNDIRRKLKPLYESRWAHDPFARARIRTRCRGTLETARCWPRRWMGGCSLRRSNVAELFHDGAWRATAGSGRRRKCWRLRASCSRKLPGHRERSEAIQNPSPETIRIVSSLRSSQ